MQKSIIILIILAVTSANAQNYCKAGTCAACSLHTDGKTKSCEGCIYSFKTAVAAGGNECTKKDSIANCALYQSASHQTKTGCDKCKVDFKQDAGTPDTAVPGKNYHKCEAVAKVAITNCESYKGWDGTAFQCDGCKKGFVVSANGLTCDVLAEASHLKDCKWMAAGGTDCRQCNSGFMLNNATPKLCVAWGSLNGCREHSTGIATKCDQCDVASGYYAVDVDATTGQKCAKSAKLIGFVSTLIAALLWLF